MKAYKLPTFLGLHLALMVAVWAQNPAGPGSAIVDARVEALIGKMTLDQKIDLLGGVDTFFIRGYAEIGWPRLKMADGPMGVRNFGFGTAYPAGIGLAATWDPVMARRIGESIGRDARAKGVHFLLGPGVNIYRAPMNGRNFEYFGEDPFLAARTAVEYIKGVQEQGVIATIKHYLGNNSEFDRHTVNTEIDERTLHEIYLPVFEAAVKEAHVGAIMDAYNLVNGEHMTQNRRLNVDVAKIDWGFRGIIMSDWRATYDGVAAANGGLDLEMPRGSFMNRASLLPALKSGKVTVATIDDKVRRIVRAAVEFGFLDREQQNLGIPRYSEEGRAVALQGAEKSLVLLKNEDGLLPLDKTAIKTVAVIGPGAYPAVCVAGGSAAVRPFNSISYLEGVSHYLDGCAKVLYDPGLMSEEDILGGTDFSEDEAGSRPGLRGEYYANPDFSGAAQLRTDLHLNFRWPGESLQSLLVPSLSIRWTGYYTAAKTGSYYWLINCSGRDACGLFVNGKLVHAQIPISRGSRVPVRLRVPMEARKNYAVKFECVFGAASSQQMVGLGVIAADDIVTPEAKKIAASADVVVLCVGYNSATETEGADRSFELEAGQDELADAISAINRKTIVVLTAGGSADVSRWIDRVPAFLYGWYAGQEGGRALPRVLFGDVNPSGHLPISFERRWADNPVHDNYYVNAPDNTVVYREGVFVGYRGYERNGVKPLFPFGHGLSYTTFAFRNLNLTPTAPRVGETVTVSFDITNTGSRAGAAVPQLYLGNPTASVRRPIKELKGFARIDLKPGETRHVILPLDPRAMSFFDTQSHAWKQEPGKFTVFVGHSSADIDLQGDYAVVP
jgi:beta-glucosidase